MSPLLHHIDPLARVIVTLLFHSIWQGALVAGAVWLITRSIERTNATTRYLAWCLTLGAILIVPLASTLPSVLGQSTLAVQTVRRFVPIETTGAGADTRGPAATPEQAFAPRWPAAPERLKIPVPASAAGLIFLAWLGVAFILAARLAVAIARLERLKRDAMPLPIEYRDRMEAWSASTRGKRRVRLCISRDVDVPVAIGLFDSMILIPTTLLEQLSEKEIDQISLHELAHLRRWDDWSNGAQRLMQALFFFNPAMALISRQLNLEREVACDDWVLSQTGNARPYASCLTKLAEVTAWPNAAIAAPGAFITRKNISIRIERLLDSHRNARPGLSFAAAGAVCVAVIAALVFSSYVSPVVAYQEPVAPIIARLASPRHKAAAKTLPPAEAAHVTTIAAMHAPLHDVAQAQPATNAGAPNKPLLPAIAPKPLHAVPVVHEAATAVHVAMRAASEAAVAAPGALSRISGMRCGGCSLENVNWAGRDLRGADLTGANLRNANLSNADLRGARLGGASLDNVNFSDADLRGADFTGANIEHVNLHGARIEGARFGGATLDVHNLDSRQARVVIASCIGCNFAGANLRDMDLSGTQMSGLNLEGADLRGANLRNAKLTGVNLRGAKLAGAKLGGASITGSNLEGVDLRDVDLNNVDLTGTNLSSATLK